jgi:hypothetical protein
VTIASCDPLPEPDPDEQPLVDALEAAGMSVRVCDWRDSSVDWSIGGLTLPRSTWDYYRHYDEFIAWAEHVAEVSELSNPVEIVRWNSHKGYLTELAGRGVPTVPTVMVEKGSGRSLDALCRAGGWSRVVVKPAVSAGSFETHVLDLHEGDSSTFDRLVASRDTLVQPYVDTVDTYGERSMIVIDGELTHSVKKHPRFAGEDERVTGPHPIEDAERALAEQVLGEVDAPLLYARVDMVRDEAGEPMLAELELIEPSLFFRFCDEALSRMVAGIERRLRTAGRTRKGA